ncbi:MAG: hypothetical protein REJ23_03125 [Brevundimonas sp.]|nr:hypothetical protein [Brevundimonas sp.]
MLLTLIALLGLSPEGQDQGPWRELIRFEATAEHPDGASLWITDAAVIAPDGPARRDVREASELWVVHGQTVGAQAYTVVTRRYDCSESEMFADKASAFTRDGRLLGSSSPTSEPDYPQTHSAEAEAFDAVCTGSRRAARGRIVSTTAEAVAGAAEAELAEATEMVSVDLDYDGVPDTVRIAMRPHSQRHDVEIVLARQPNRTINVVAMEQPPAGPIVERRLRPVERDRYVTACRMTDGRDQTPCRAEYRLVQRGVEIVSAGYPSVLVWLEDAEPKVARLPL